MKKIVFLLAFALMMISAKTQAQATITVADSIGTSTTWTANNIYVIQGFVYVVNGVTLTIEPGTIIKGDHNFTGSSLIIERGAKIIANGTETNPIIFTSDQPAGSRVRGDWGGIILCGRAPINPAGGQSQIEGGPRSYFGGTDTADNSGSLKYVRIEFAGYPFQPNKEINGLTMGGVGNGTTIDHVQVSYSNDDSFEWFGGKVNCKHLIAFRGLDDDFDTDYGYCGKLQYLVSLRDSAVADISTSNSFESDNDASGSTNTPITAPYFANVSSFGPKVNSTNPYNPLFGRAMHLRRNTRLSCYNSVFAGWPTGFYVDGNLTDANANSNVLQIENCVMSGMGSFFAVPAGQTWTVADSRSYYFSAARDNDTLASNNLLLVNDPFNYNAPDFTLQASSPLANKASWTNTRLANDSFFDKVSYAGAFGTDDWTEGWANWAPQSSVYFMVNPSEAWITIGDSASLTAYGATTYSWSPASSLSSANSAVVIAKPTVTTTYTVTAGDGSGYTSSKFVTVYVNDTSSVKENEIQVSNVRCYPNPFESSTTVSFKLSTRDHLSLQIFDIFGKLISSPVENREFESGATSFELQTEDLAAGTYILMITSKNGRSAYKLIKK
jgi:hypothetical protein